MVGLLAGSGSAFDWFGGVCLLRSELIMYMTGDGWCRDALLMLLSILHTYRLEYVRRISLSVRLRGRVLHVVLSNTYNPPIYLEIIQ